MLYLSAFRTFAVVVFLNFLADFGYVRAEGFEPSESNVIASCKDARVVDNTQLYCSFATWNAAHIYAKVNYTDYSSGNPLGDSVQNNYASNIYDTLITIYNNKPVSSECSSALQRLACVTAFPSCQVSGSSLSAISYNRPCRLQCEQANARCPFVVPCENYPETNCLLTLPPGFFVIEPKSGPFEPLPIIYGISLAIWIIFAVTWNYLTFVRYKNACVIFCRVVSGIPIIKGELNCISLKALSMISSHIIFASTNCMYGYNTV
jgi:Fz domain